MKERHRPKTFGRRKGKTLRPQQQRVIDEILPRLAVNPKEFGASIAREQSRCEVWLEIGFGGGEHLRLQAKRNAAVQFVGCEPFVNGVAKLLRAVEDDNLVNVRVHVGDAMELVRELPGASIGRIYLLYPDPWPKPKQRKRRIINDDNLAQLARILKPGRELRFATDIDDYCAWTLARLRASHEFSWDPGNATDWLTPWADWEPTRYEEKARREGRQSAYLTFRRLG
ncbi:MAG: tRNA (guanosine(46)-N(7))-methyltransferase TrmB [Beijerinckiaceae bacterium]